MLLWFDGVTGYNDACGASTGASPCLSTLIEALHCPSAIPRPVRAELASLRPSLTNQLKTSILRGRAQNPSIALNKVNS